MDETLIGFGDGVWINGSHWYADPFMLYSDYTINHYYELSFYETYVGSQINVLSGLQYQQDMFFLYNIINNDTVTPITPVPEPSSFCLFLVGMLVAILFNKVLTRKRR